MYGKFFASAFTGSMFGAGSDVFAVWAYVIAHAVAGKVELNPKLLGAMLGAPAERVEAAIGFLCSPDPESRNPAEEGRRLLPDGAFQYQVVSHSIYRALQTEEQRRSYNRIKKQESRARIRAKQAQMSIDSQCQSMSVTHTEADTERSRSHAPALGLVGDLLSNQLGKSSRKSTVLVKLAHTVIDEMPGGTEQERRDAIQDRAAKAGIHYDSSRTIQALQAAIRQRMSRRK